MKNKKEEGRKGRREGGGKEDIAKKISEKSLPIESFLRLLVGLVSRACNS